MAPMKKLPCSLVSDWVGPMVFSLQATSQLGGLKIALFYDLSRFFGLTGVSSASPDVSRGDSPVGTQFCWNIQDGALMSGQMVATSLDSAVIGRLKSSLLKSFQGLSLSLSP